MAQPTPYERQYNFTDHQTVNPSRPLPAAQVDAELNAIEQTLGQTLANLAQIQRDDGQLANQSVTPESLSAGTLALIQQGEYTVRGAWTADTVYAVGDVVEYNQATYLATVPHTSAVAFSTDRDAGRWLLIANGALDGGAAAVDLFSGDGVEAEFTLSVNYASSDAAVVFVNGVAQIPTQDFTIASNLLTFVSAPPAPAVPGNDNIMVRGTAVEAQLAASGALQAELDAQGHAATAQEAATTAGTHATNASNSATAAGTSATNASNSATAAETSATNAGNSATAAANSATTASGHATTATTKADEAATSATNAATSATNASNSATTASDHATTATTKASEAATSASNAADSASSAATLLDEFDDRYLGAKEADPSLDNDGNALITGALYFNTTSGVMKVYTGSAWSPVSVASSSFIATLLDDADAATARATLGFTSSGTAPLHLCRAWVNFNGTGVVSIRASGNVSSITDNGTGDYTINFTTAMPDANFAATGMLSPDVQSPVMEHIASATGSVRVSAKNGSTNASFDPARAFIIVVG